MAFILANTAGAAWAWRNVKRKTDRDDALKLALRPETLGSVRGNAANEYAVATNGMRGVSRVIPVHRVAGSTAGPPRAGSRPCP
jgi:hypothetical protein